MVNVIQMTLTELKHYLSENRSDDDKFSEALAELLKRDPSPVIFSKDIPLDEQERIFMEKIAKH